MKKYFNSALLILFIFIGCGNNKDGNKIEASGTIEATNIILSAKTGGDIKQIDFDEGAKLNRGDTIMMIDHSILFYQLQQAIAQEEIASLQLKLLQKGARIEDIKQAKEFYNQQKINKESAERDLERMKTLFKSNSVSQKQFEDAESKYNLVYAQFTSASENLKKTENIARPEELEQAKANLKKATASADLLKKNISDCFIVSPINGYIVKKFVEFGETVSPMTNLVKVSDLETVKLTIYVSALDLPKIKTGQKAIIKIDAYENKSYEGKVIFISPEAEFTPKNIQTKDERVKQVFAVKIEIKNKELELKPGMPADAELN